MSLLVGDEDTICALSTPEGHGGIAVIRVSGSQAVSISRRLCPFLPENPETHRIYYGILISAAVFKEIDEVLVSYFREGKSFTGENTIEISCHGSGFLSTTILQELVSAGCRLAKPGEFSYRAYMNGRIDLVQAEGVLNLIQSRSSESAKVALSHLRGRISREYKEIEDLIMSVVCQLEAGIDFVHENLSIDNSAHLAARLENGLAYVNRLLASYSHGRQLKEGSSVLIAGITNAGKSSLMNALLSEEKSIVTDIPGTTRDLIEATLNIRGVDVAFVDSAGLRVSQDTVENIGISKAKSAIVAADYVLYIFDLTQDLDVQHDTYRDLAKNKKVLVVANKVDIADESTKKMLGELLGESKALYISIKNKIGIDHLISKIEELIEPAFANESAVVTQARHAETLNSMSLALQKGVNGLRDGLSPELVIADLKSAVAGVHELLGISVDDRVLDRIFKEFCIGK